MIKINLTDLRYSNSIYILRTLFKEKKTIEQIAKETDLTIIAVNKIVYDLIKKEILIKIKDTSQKMGRPKLFVTYNPFLFSAIITKENNRFLAARISINGEYRELFTTPINLFTHESNTISFIKGRIGTVDKNCVKMIYVDEYAHEIDDIKLISKYHPIDLIVSSLTDEEKVIYFEYDNYQILINHGNAKIIECEQALLNKIVDVDDSYIFDNKKEAIIEAVRRLTIKELEKRI